MIAPLVGVMLCGFICSFSVLLTVASNNRWPWYVGVIPIFAMTYAITGTQPADSPHYVAHVIILTCIGIYTMFALTYTLLYLARYAVRSAQ